MSLAAPPDTTLGSHDPTDLVHDGITSGGQFVEIGLDHSRADVAVRERMAISSADLPTVLTDLQAFTPDVVILSTCNRVEVYLLIENPDEGAQRVIEYLAARSGISVEAAGAVVSERRGAEAVRHLCRVATGLESMIVGEPEIAGQVRAALKAAERAGTASVVMRRLFDSALGVAGRVRGGTALGRHAVSVSAAAVRLGERALGGLQGKVGMVIGAGSVGRAAAQVMASCGVSQLLIASRRIESARLTAEKVGGEASGLDDCADALAASDLLICATSAPDFVIHAAAIRAALSRRPDRQLVIVDVAVPRDVEPAVREIEGCTLLDMDDLASAREASLAARRLVAADAEEHIDRAVERFMAWWHGRSVAAIVSDLVAHAERVRKIEVERSLARFDAPTDRERALVEVTTAAMVKKLLHQPIVQLKRRGAADEARVWAQTLGELFALPGDSPVVSTPGRDRRTGRLDPSGAARRTAS